MPISHLCPTDTHLAKLHAFVGFRGPRRARVAQRDHLRQLAIGVCILIVQRCQELGDSACLALRYSRWSPWPHTKDQNEGTSLAQQVPPLACHSNLGLCQDTASRFLGQCQHTDWIGLCWAILGAGHWHWPAPGSED